ncbi:hypothetical protein ACR2YZ_28855 [Klebsiella pneumoniae]
MIVLPAFNLFSPINVLNSLCRVKIIFIQIKFNRVGTNQKIRGNIIKIINVLNQLIDKLKIVVDGSKTENKLVIIFN